jgi:hypothetical protein
MRDQNVRCVARLSFNVDRSAINRITPRRITAIGPVKDAILEIQLEVDRFWQMVEQDLDISPIGCRFTFRDFDSGTKDAPLITFIRPFLRPVDLLPRRVDGDADALSCQIVTVGITTTGFDKCFDVRAI